MNKEKQKIVPELRFPEFRSSEAWVIDKFSSFIKLYRGSSPRPINQFLTKEENGVNWIKIGDTKNAINFKITSVGEKITLNGSKKSRKVTKGELILANSMSYGATYELEIDGCIYDGWFVLREFEDDFDKGFLLQLLNSNFLQIQYKRLAAGGIVQNISSEIVYNTLLPKISKEEQQKIANCLSSLDEVINVEIEKLDLLKDHKKGLLQQLFPAEGQTQPKFRFPEFKNDGNWEEKKVEVACDKPFSGGTPKSNNPKFYGGSIPFIRSAEIDKETTELYLTEEGLKNSSAKLVKKGAVLIAMYGANSGDVAISKIDGAINQAILCLRSKTNNSFLFQYLTHKKNWITNKYLQGGQGNLSGDILKSVELLFPKKTKEQQIIANCLSAVDELITVQEKKIKQLKDHKKGLLQQLFPTINELTI